MYKLISTSDRIPTKDGEYFVFKKNGRKMDVRGYSQNFMDLDNFWRKNYTHWIEEVAEQKK